MSTGGGKNGKGRPRDEGTGKFAPVALTEEHLRQLDALAAMYCTHEEIAAVLGISSDTLTRHHAERIEKGRSQGKASLRRAQFQSAIGVKAEYDVKGRVVRREQAPNITAQIWLGKQILGQTDKVDIMPPKPLHEMSDDELNAFKRQVGVTRRFN